VLVSAVENNLRFPGQYYDAETGLHYNWWRYYDPRVGRYVRTDPVGLYREDTNLFAYVVNNPSLFLDPWGLERNTSNLDQIENLLGSIDSFETAKSVLEAIRNGGKVKPGSFLPNPTLAALRVLNAITKLEACKRMLTASRCEELNEAEWDCWTDLLVEGIDVPTFPYIQNSMEGYYVDIIFATKAKRVCGTVRRNRIGKGR